MRASDEKAEGRRQSTRSRIGGRFAAVLSVVLTIVYPVAVFYALTNYSPRVVGLLGLAIVIPLFALRFRNKGREHLWAVLRVPLIILALLLAGAIFDDPRFVLAMPVLISLALLGTFGASLRGGGPSMIERFARMQEPELSAAQVVHCRQATIAWCAFFLVNAGIAAALALLEMTAWWAIYTGGIAYAAMGVMFAGEFVVRRYRFREYGRGPHDRLLALLFPPRTVRGDR
jgi:uncharacterized membrane protein